LKHKNFNLCVFCEQTIVSGQIFPPRSGAEYLLENAPQYGVENNTIEDEHKDSSHHNRS